MNTATLAAPPRVAYSIDEAAAAMGLSTKHLRRLVATGELRAVRSGRRVLIQPSALVDYLATLDEDTVR
jgi:excisionase family DNA binding protein